MLILNRTLVEDTLKTDVDTGEISGYAATWTYQGDGIRFVKGAFQKTITERAGKIPLMVRHAVAGGSVMETVGWVTRGEEDEKGLFIYGTFLDTEFAQAVRQQAIDGGIRAFSISAKLVKFDIQNEIKVCSEAMLAEVTLTNTPADIEAEVYSARSAEESSENTDTQVGISEPSVKPDTHTDDAIRERIRLTSRMFS